MIKLGLRDERSITDHLRRKAVIPRGARVVLGIGDDCAIYRPRGSAEDLLFTTDMFVENVHFLRETHKPAEAGRKALVRSLSDIAAMGGTPRFCLVSLSVSDWADSRWVVRFFDGILELAVESGTILAGGDLSHSERLICDVMVCGDVPRGKGLRRDGARPGNDIYVSGRLGGSALGLRTQKGKAQKRHLYPQPRLGLGRFIRETLHATAAMDISDGLSLDLRRLCLASGVAAEIQQPPRFPGATSDDALHGGEEYELLFTVRRGTRVPPTFERIPLTKIGTIIRGKGDLWLDGKRAPPLGYDHFADRSL